MLLRNKAEADSIRETFALEKAKPGSKLTPFYRLQCRNTKIVTPWERFCLTALCRLTMAAVKRHSELRQCCRTLSESIPFIAGQPLCECRDESGWMQARAPRTSSP